MSSQRKQRVDQRHLARQVAVQARYWLQSQPWDDLARILDVIAHDRKLATKGVKHAFLVCKQAEEHAHEYDQELASVSQHWDSDRIGRTERIIVALALAEWDSRELDTPPKVVLNEAVTLAAEFCGEKSGQFMNGVLDALGRERGLLGRSMRPSYDRRASDDTGSGAV